jgi:FKBP-type peptidyl-prolyl cis-trans isomerase SlyD
MAIEINKVVSLTYHLNVVKLDQSEEFVEETPVDEPLVFIYGAGMMLPVFEENLKGKSVGDAFDFILSAEDGYGDYQADQVVAIPLDVFKEADGSIDQEMMQVGRMLPMMDNSGNHMRGIIKEIHVDHVLMDFNHPMAGQVLHFTGQIQALRDATAEELDHGHVHGAGGHHH